MSHVIHCRQRSDNMKYRVWSTVVDDYLTEELTEEQLREFLLNAAVVRAREELEHELPARLKRARLKGTSSFVEEEMPVEGPWQLPP